MQDFENLIVMTIAIIMSLTIIGGAMISINLDRVELNKYTECIKHHEPKECGE